MQLRHRAAASTASSAAMLLRFSLLLLPSAAGAHNITSILAKFPEFSTFNHYLTETHLAPEINRRETITVCAVDNDGMADLLAKHLSPGVIRDVLSFHILLDYFDAKKLHQITGGTALAATMFQATGLAPGSSGFVNITDLRGGKVGFSPEDGAGVSATFVKSVEAVPYNISVIQISAILPSPEAEAPAPEPSRVNLTNLMSAGGCKAFATALVANPAAEQTFASNVESGLTVFCPGDDAMKRFISKYKNLTADGKQSLLEYHGIPIYQSLPGLKSSNGLTNTLATDGAEKYDFTVQNAGNDVTIETKIITAKIVKTLIDQQPLAIFELDKVLMPVELFKSSLPPAPVPAPQKLPAKEKSLPAPAAPSDSPADAPDGDVADDNGAVRFNGGTDCAVILSFWFVFSVL